MGKIQPQCWETEQALLFQSNNLNLNQKARAKYCPGFFFKIMPILKQAFRITLPTYPSRIQDFFSIDYTLQKNQGF